MASVEETPHGTFRVRYRNSDGRSRSKTCKTEKSARFFATMIEETLEASRLEKELAIGRNERMDYQDRTLLPTERETPPALVVSPFQKEIIDYLIQAPGNTATSAEMSASLGSRPQAIGASLQHLQKAGISINPGRGVWQIRTDRIGAIIVGKKDGRGKVKRAAKTPSKTAAAEMRSPQTTAQKIREEFNLGALFEMIGMDVEEQAVVRSLDDHRLYRLSVI